MKLDCGLDTSYFYHNNIHYFSYVGHSDHTSSSDDAISKNSEYVKKCRKLDYLIDLADDGSGGIVGEVRRACQISAETPEFSNIDRTSYYNHMLALLYVTNYTDVKRKIYATEPIVLFGRTNRVINCGKKECGVGHLIGVEPITSFLKFDETGNYR
ncbi:hypothetical protein C1646_666456 [Rhizophagus diaphanus]|nr:hypothetical protein C1646_666456 [Rhizophagus diaphanus] [Rhizophagus sp. MUCL 43196]